MADPKSFICTCPYCAAKVDAVVIARYGWLSVEMFADRTVALCRCPVCDEPLLLSLAERKDKAGGSWFSVDDRLYPPARKTRAGVPPTIDRSIAEAHTCLEAGALVACAIMCRRTLEALCKHHLPDAKGTLADRIEKLHTAKIINDKLLDWATVLREHGNLAAHDPEASFSFADVRDLLEFSEALVEYVFVLSNRFEAFKKRRTARKEAEKTAAAKVATSAADELATAAADDE